MALSIEVLRKSLHKEIPRTQEDRLGEVLDSIKSKPLSPDKRIKIAEIYENEPFVMFEYNGETKFIDELDFWEKATSKGYNKDRYSVDPAKSTQGVEIAVHEDTTTRKSIYELEHSHLTDGVKQTLVYIRGRSLNDDKLLAKPKISEDESFRGPITLLRKPIR